MLCRDRPHWPCCGDCAEAPSTFPGDPAYDLARRAWNTAADQRPAAVAYPADAAEVAAVVRAARSVGLRVAPQATGHHAAVLGVLSDTVLVRTAAMTGVSVDRRDRRPCAPRSTPSPSPRRLLCSACAWSRRGRGRSYWTRPCSASWTRRPSMPSRQRRFRAASALRAAELRQLGGALAR